MVLARAKNAKSQTSKPQMNSLIEPRTSISIWARPSREYHHALAWQRWREFVTERIRVDWRPFYNRWERKCFCYIFRQLFGVGVLSNDHADAILSRVLCAGCVGISCSRDFTPPRLFRETSSGTNPYSDNCGKFTELHSHEKIPSGVIAELEVEKTNDAHARAHHSTYRWLGERSVWLNYLSFFPDMWFVRVGNEVWIQWDNVDKKFEGSMSPLDTSRYRGTLFRFHSDIPGRVPQPFGTIALSNGIEDRKH